MKRVFLLAALACFVFSVSFAQNKKAEKEAAEKQKFEKAVAAIDIKDFVIIVDTYESNGGTIETNTDVNNFFSYEIDAVYLQGAIVSGNNFTNKLSVTDYNKETDKKGNIKMVMRVRGSFIEGKIEVFMKKGSNWADVIFTPTKGTTRRFSGEIIPKSESKYFRRPGEI
jgi:protein involved in ribonucleotide reduction